MEHGIAQRVGVYFEVIAQGVAQRVDSAGGQCKYEIDVVGCSRLALQGSSQASTEEVFGADGGKRRRHLERDIDRILAGFSRHRA